MSSSIIRRNDHDRSVAAGGSFDQHCRGHGPDRRILHQRVEWLLLRVPILICERSATFFRWWRCDLLYLRHYSSGHAWDRRSDWTSCLGTHLVFAQLQSYMRGSSPSYWHDDGLHYLHCHSLWSSANMPSFWILHLHWNFSTRSRSRYHNEQPRKLLCLHTDPRNCYSDHHGWRRLWNRYRRRWRRRSYRYCTWRRR